MGADDEGKEPVADDLDDGEGYKTGTSTPGYRHPDGTREPLNIGSSLICQMSMR
jgi:hypothetical protein